MSDTATVTKNLDRPDQERSITVNDVRVEWRNREGTGATIKAAAIATGAPIEPDFVLSRMLAGGRQEIIPDDLRIQVKTGDAFWAVPGDDNSDAARQDLKDTVNAGVEEIWRAYPDTRWLSDSQGGAWVEIPTVDVGDRYVTATSALVCLLPFALPAADVYPIFLDRTLIRADGGPLGEGFSVTDLSWPGDPTPRPVIQVSRRTRGDVTTQTPLIKIEKVLEWVRNR